MWPNGRPLDEGAGGGGCAASDVAGSGEVVGQGRGHSRIHRNVCREVMLDVARHQRTNGDRDFTTLCSDKTLGPVCQRGEYSDVCSKEELWAAEAEEEAKTPLGGAGAGAGGGAQGDEC